MPTGGAIYIKVRDKDDETLLFTIYTRWGEIEAVRIDTMSYILEQKKKEQDLA